MSEKHFKKLLHFLIYISNMNRVRLNSSNLQLNYVDNLHEHLLGAVEFESFLLLVSRHQCRRFTRVDKRS